MRAQSLVGFAVGIATERLARGQGLAMNRDAQIEFVESAELRHQGRAKRLLSNPKFKAVLSQYDAEVLPPEQRRVERAI